MSLLKRYKWHKIANTIADIKWTSGNVADVEVDGKCFTVARFNNELYGFASQCPHAGAPMLDGYVDGGCRVVCPVHSMKFNLRNGREANGDGCKLKTYPVEQREDGIYFGIDEGGMFKWL